jgi:hypothetical protein
VYVFIGLGFPYQCMQELPRRAQSRAVSYSRLNRSEPSTVEILSCWARSMAHLARLIWPNSRIWSGLLYIEPSPQTTKDMIRFGGVRDPFVSLAHILHHGGWSVRAPGSR